MPRGPGTYGKKVGRPSKKKKKKTKKPKVRERRNNG
jgi:hypothetical protein